jgi:hypothetical protein
VPSGLSDGDGVGDAVGVGVGAGAGVADGEGVGVGSGMVEDTGVPSPNAGGVATAASGVGNAPTTDLRVDESPDAEDVGAATGAGAVGGASAENGKGVRIPTAGATRLVTISAFALRTTITSAVTAPVADGRRCMVIMRSPASLRPIGPKFGTAVLRSLRSAQTVNGAAIVTTTLTAVQIQSIRACVGERPNTRITAIAATEIDPMSTCGWNGNASALPPAFPFGVTAYCSLVPRTALKNAKASTGHSNTAMAMPANPRFLSSFGRTL